MKDYRRVIHKDVFPPVRRAEPLLWAALALLGLLLSGCAPAPIVPYSLGNLLLEEDFSQGYGWDAETTGGVTIGVRDGAYRMRADVSQYVRGFNAERHTDVVIEVDALQLSPDERNAFGVICRGNPAATNASGYYFLIGSDGSYSIRKGVGSDLEPLVAWERSSVVRRGAAANTLRVACIGDHLALYVNERQVAQARDTTYQGGFAGFVVAAAEGQVIEAVFDDLRIWEAFSPR